MEMVWTLHIPKNDLSLSPLVSDLQELEENPSY